MALAVRPMRTHPDRDASPCLVDRRGGGPMSRGPGRQDVAAERSRIALAALAGLTKTKHVAVQARLFDLPAEEIPCK